ncbi:methyltransferase-like protein 17, mitochondrial [Hemiscyllium ocellatum]|uniref:methyltransferase-like protein 17, mitochondrial n=1 Tax=Hemiscyllium ocellatum TaxID=170820 RepID=UPI0029667E35|nr:methyltransferase-like protein 17, mitochondrial [Hemiscyllium ocellatum]
MTVRRGRIRMLHPFTMTGYSGSPSPSSGLLPHRRHPGICRLPAVHLPQALIQAVRLLLPTGETPIRRLEDCARELSNFLWSRKRPVEDPELQERAQRLWERLTGSQGAGRAGNRGPVGMRGEGGNRYRAAWGDSLREYLCVDPSAAMHQIAEFLMRGGSDADTEHIRGVYLRQYLPVSPKVSYDLVISAYSLSELPSLADRLCAVETLWRKTDSFLVLIENGTREGHQILMEAREAVLKAKGEESSGHVFAPCPHDGVCPKLTAAVPAPCNFTQAYHPLPFPWNGGVKLERFSYVILRRGRAGETQSWPRVIQPVLCRTRHAHVHLCTADGTLCHTVLTARRSGRDLYRCARNSTWGDRLPMPHPPPEGQDGAGQAEDSTAETGRAD